MKYLGSDLRILKIIIYIDNKKLDGFFDFFASGRCTGKCSKCGYCKRVAQNCISSNVEVREYLLELYNKFDDIKL